MSVCVKETWDEREGEREREREREHINQQHINNI